jgi:hypothetical protein
METKGDTVFNELHERLTSIDNRIAFLPRNEAEAVRSTTASISVWLARAESKPYVQRESYVQQIVAEIETVETKLERFEP